MAEFRLVARFAEAARWLQFRKGWSRLGTAALAGIVASLGFAPLDLWLATFLAMPVLAWLIDASQSGGRNLRQAFFTGWSFGFGYFLFGMHWIVFPFMVDADQHAWQIPFVAVLFPGGLGLFWGASAVVAARFWRDGWTRILILAVSVCALEWLRGHVLTGLPWNLPGYVWSDSVSMSQSASILGIYGLSLVTMVAALIPAAGVDARGVALRNFLPLLSGIAIVAALWLFGLARVPTAPADATGIFVRIVQPNVPQREKWAPDLLMRNWHLLTDLTGKPGLDRVNAVVWPEAAPPFLMLSTDGALEAVAELMPDKTVLLTGTQRVERGNPNRYFNSFVAIDGKGRVLSIYDKSHLVPFGEYLPLFQLLEPLGITQLTGMHGGFSQGDGVRTDHVQGLPSFGVLICYEAIFPGDVVRAGDRPDWLVNVTDDSWFGPWTGPYQHLGIARVRAIEEGLPIARSANTGVSAMIDPYGRIIGALELNKPGVLDVALPKALKPTVYSFAGDIIFVVLALVLVVVGVIFSRSTP